MSFMVLNEDNRVKLVNSSIISGDFCFFFSKRDEGHLTGLAVQGGTIETLGT